jgi:hypothetical protein
MMYPELLLSDVLLNRRFDVVKLASTLVIVIFRRNPDIR